VGCGNCLENADLNACVQQAIDRCN
jgi:hypothetical protein